MKEIAIILFVKMIEDFKNKAWNLSNANKEYFSKQLNNVYESTIQFFRFIDIHININKQTKILDVCGGSGANAIYAKKNIV